MTGEWIIRYRSDSTVNGRVVGLVYAQHLPQFGRDVWSYSYDPINATLFDSEEAASAVIAGKRWPEAGCARWCRGLGLMTEQFTCAMCGGTFDKAWTDEEATAEAAENFTPEELKDQAVVCDPCFKKMGLT